MTNYIDHKESSNSAQYEPQDTDHPDTILAMPDSSYATSVIGAKPIKCQGAATCAWMPMKTELNGITFEVVADTGCSATTFGREFVEKFGKNVRYDKCATNRMESVGITHRMDTRATFDIYIPGIRRGKRQYGYFTISGWVMENLKPKALIGMDFLTPNGADVHCRKGTITWESCKDLQTKVNIFKRRPIRRKVTSTQRYTVPARTAQLIHVDYDDVPSDKSFLLDGTIQGSESQLITRKTPKIMIIANSSDKPVKIRRKQRVGTIIEPDFQEQAQVSWDRACFIQQAARWQQNGDSRHDDSQTDDAIVDRFYAMADVSDTDSTPIRIAKTRDPEFDMSDTVMAILQMPETEVEQAIKTQRECEVWRDMRQNTAAGFKKPQGEPETKTAQGATVCNDNPSFSRRLRKILEAKDIWRYKGIIKMPDSEMMRINLVEGWQTQHIRSRPYRVGIEDRAVLDTKFDQMQKDGQLEWMMKPSPFACPVFVVWRVMNGIRKARIVIDLRQLNDLCAPDCYPMPTQDDIIAHTVGKKRFTVLDMSAFYFQLPIFKDHRERVVYSTHRGLEKSNVVPMGFKGSPAFGQRFMDNILRPVAKFCMAYMDDIVIFSDSDEQHLEHVEAVTSILQKVGLAVAAKKSFAGFPAITLLGFTVSGAGIQTTRDRVAALTNIKMPTTLASLEQYIGLTTYLARFVPFYQQRIAPLQRRKTTMLKENREKKAIPKGKIARRKWTKNQHFEPTADERQSFNDIQKILAQEQFLSHHDPNKPLFINPDASAQRGFGAMLFHLADGADHNAKRLNVQDVCPVWFLSRHLKGREKRYYPTELEIACVVWTTRTMRPMLQSCTLPSIVLTDHSASKQVIEGKSLATVNLDRGNIQLAAASAYLSQFRLVVRHIPGRDNLVPDALSRLPAIDTEDTPEHPDQGELEDIDIEQTSFWTTTTVDMAEDLKANMTEGYNKDKRLRKILDYIKRHETLAEQQMREQTNAKLPKDRRPHRRLRNYPFVLEDNPSQKEQPKRKRGRPRKNTTTLLHSGSNQICSFFSFSSSPKNPPSPYSPSTTDSRIL